MEMTVIRVLVLVFSVVVHECAHGWVALKLGDTTARDSGRLTLNPIPHIDPVGSILVPAVLSLMGSFPLGWAKPVPVRVGKLNDPGNDHPKVAAAGPASNFLLAAVSAVMLGVLVGLETRSSSAAGTDGHDLVHFLMALFRAGILINVVLGVFNLLPLPPLDGSWILVRFLPPEARVRFNDLRRFGFMFVVGFLMLAHYTGFGDVLQAGLMGAVRPFLRLSLAVAEAF